MLFDKICSVDFVWSDYNRGGDLNASMYEKHVECIGHAEFKWFIKHVYEVCFAERLFLYLHKIMIIIQVFIAPVSFKILTILLII